MNKILITSLSTVILGQAVEVDFGNGTFGMQGGFLGLAGEIDCDIATFSIANRHDNIDRFYYGYDLTWYDSKRMIQAQHTYNAMASAGNQILNNIPLGENATIPEMEYRLKGMDVNLQFGYDLLHESDDDYIAAGLLLSISMPWIDATKSGSTIPNLGFMLDNAGNLLDAKDMFDKSKTEVMTYKIGPSITLQKPLIDKQLFLFGAASYAYQTGNIKNDYAHADFTVDGTFQSYNIGLQFIPFDHEFEWGWLTLSSKLYATLGYRYSKWDLDKMSIDISGNQISSDILAPLAMKFGMDSSVGYFGIGYQF